MHASRFNTVVENGSEKLIYNSANGAFGVLGTRAQEAYIAPQTHDDIAAELSAAGFLTKLSDKEELAVVRRIFEEEAADTSTLDLCIAPTYACNYRCPYCYEQGHNAIGGIMDEDVIEAICEFVEDRYDANPFVQLSVQWYGGDPSLALSSVDSLSQKLMAFCDEREILYSAMMLSNCNLIDEPAVDLLVRCRITEIFITVDGPEEIHNARRVAADGSNSFKKQLEAARLCKKAGINVRANMNLDKVNLKHYPEIAIFLRNELGIELTTTMLCDYGHFFGTREFKKPDFDLFTHEEYAHLNHRAFVEAGFTPRQLREIFHPVRRFCRGQRHAYYVIDVRGDAYKCDGYIGEREHVMFNIFDEPDEESLHAITFDPTHDEKCSSCSILPLCHGNCIWERRKTDMPCHPLKYTIKDYLRDWRSCFGACNDSFTLLAEPVTPS